MQFFPDRQTVIALGFLSIKWYAVIILTGAFITYSISKHNFKQKGYPLTLLENLFFGCLLTGVLGARLWYILFEDLGAYLTNPIRILSFQEGGLAIHGGLICGALFGYYYLKKKGYTFMILADEIVYTILVAQAVGRYGNFMNQEAYGPIVSESFFNYLPAFIKDGMFIDGAYRMPMFFLESTGNLIGFLLIHFILRKQKNYKNGDSFYAYLIWYGLVRFFVEIFRTDALIVGNTGLKIAQLISVGFMVVGLLGMLGVFRKLTHSKPTLIFDFDGTLMDSKATIQKTFEELFATEPLKKEINADDLDWVVGPKLTDSFTRYFVSENHDDLLKKYRTVKEKYLHLTKPSPHAIELLKSLKQQGYKIGISSNKITVSIEKEMAMVGMGQYIDCIFGLDLASKTKPDPAAAIEPVLLMHGKIDNAIVIGDSPDDILMAQQANFFSVGYYESEHRMTLLKQQQPNVLINDLNQLETILKENKTWNHFTKL